MTAPFGTVDPADAMRNAVAQATDTGLRDAREAPTLEPCPYCKSAVRMRRESGVTGKVCRSRYYRERVVCTNENCRAVGPMGKSPNSTVSKWNRVAATAAALAPSEALEQAREALATGERALTSASHFIRNGIALGFIRMPDASTPDPAHGTPDKVDEARDLLRAVLSSLPPSPETGEPS